MFEDTNRVLRISISKNNRQDNSYDEEISQKQYILIYNMNLRHGF